jgi:hypothetical protein
MLAVFSTPDAGTATHVSVDADPAPPFAFVRLATHGAWTQVTTPNAEFTVLSGWVSSASLRQVPSAPPWSGSFSSGGTWCGTPSSQNGADVYVGGAYLPASTAVYAEPGKGRWATLRSAVGVTVQWRRSERWVAIAGAPGVQCIGGEGARTVRAWIERSAVKLPGDAAAP